MLGRTGRARQEYALIRQPRPAWPALLVASALILVSALLIIPPGSMPMLAATVAALEYSPFIAIIDLAGMLVVGRALRGRRRLMVATLTLLAVATALALRPVARFNATARAANAQLHAHDGIARYTPLDAFRQPALAGAVREQAVHYRAADGSPLSMRLYRGTQAGPRPLVVVIYGGAWQGGTPAQGAGLDRALASRGFTVAAIDYRHAPAAPFPAALDDVLLSIALLRDSAAAWAIDPGHIALLGRSSGGHLAELAAWTTGAPRVQAVVAIYAPFDLVRGYDDLPAPDPIGVRHVLHDFLGGAPAERRSAYHDASPSSFVRAGLPPTLLLYGARDHVVKPEFNRGAASLLRAVHVPVVQVEVPWGEHGFDMAPGGLGAQLATDVVVGFLERTLGASR